MKPSKTAFIHRSYLNEHSEPGLESNERLEFLGDAVLQFLSSEFLFEKYPQRPEGELTAIRSALVCTTSLAEESRNREYGKGLKLSVGEEETGGRDKDYILANTFEAVLGALYLEEGIEKCRHFLQEGLLKKTELIIAEGQHIDFKSHFQEVAQAKLNITPNYKVLKEWGPDHEKNFLVAVFVGSKEWGRGEGASKQKAEVAAAEDGLKHLQKQ
ncbi:MAG: ribonuclease III [bacterium]